MNWIDSSMSNKSYSSLISSYYASEIMPNYSNVIKNNISKIQLTKLPKEFSIENDDESDISKLIENTLRQKYNFVIPAIEIHINPNSKIELINSKIINNIVQKGSGGGIYASGNLEKSPLVTIITGPL